jgi:hypothetical protein
MTKKCHECWITIFIDGRKANLCYCYCRGWYTPIPHQLCHKEICLCSDTFSSLCIRTYLS